MVWCLSLAILSLIISQGADGELHSLASRTPWGGWHCPGGSLCTCEGRGGRGLVLERLRISSVTSQSLREPTEILMNLPSQP